MQKDYKDTLLMPKTDFEMKANLTVKEPIFRKQWLDREIYKKSLNLNKLNGKGRFILHDGPPYANGNLHVGHSLNKILKDIIVRRKNMEGYYSPFVPGWDTHGLPIENKMLAEMKMTKDDLDPISLRKEAAKYAYSQIEKQKSQFESMQLFSDLKEKYVTLDPLYESLQLKLFKKMTLDGLIYKGLKPVYWSPSSQSALAEAEVEYQEHMSPQVIVSFNVYKPFGKVKDNDKILIMTTTPWTLIANSGVAVGNDFDYDRVSFGQDVLIIASKLTQNVIELINKQRLKDNKEEIIEYKIIETIKGRDIVGTEYKRPFSEKTSPVISGHHVTTDAGTGLVHMAPLFGEDDYLIGKENQLEMIMHVDDKGHFTSEAGEFEGMFYADANKEIGLKLHKEGNLLSLRFLKHSYPHDWRTHKPVIYRGVPQWFVNINKIKNKIQKALEDVVSTPEWGVSRISKMIEGRTEWTISRQRTWGVPIIIFYDNEGAPVIKEEIFDYVIDLVAKHGSDIWWEKDADELLPEKFRNQGFTKEMDIMDVWFDSGSSSIAVKPNGEEGPFDLYLEGSDQYRGWFNSSLINSVAYRGKSPFKQLLSHGFVLDGKQQKMSKSKGNVIDPLEIIRKQGAEILRLWSANSEFTSDVTISDDILNQNAEIYRRVRNTFRFMLGNLFDFDINKDSIELKNMHKYIFDVLNNYEVKVNSLYNEYKFIDIVKETNKLLVDLSGWYFSYAKDSLYCDKFNSEERRSIQTNIFNTLKTTLKVLAPILPTTTEEAYMLIPNLEKEESLFLNRVSNDISLVNYDDSPEYFYNKIRPEANKSLEEAIKKQIIKRTNEAFLTIVVPEEKRMGNEAYYAKLLMVAKVEFGLHYKAIKLVSEKCIRCWNHFETLKDDLCTRCINVLSDK